MALMECRQGEYMRRAQIILALSTSACWGSPPGKGEAAERGYARAAPIIAALDSYHDQRGKYPTSLEELAPQFIPSVTAVQRPAAQSGYPWEYSRDSLGYALTFRYTGPGMNHCRYRPDTRAWACGGYF